MAFGQVCSKSSLIPPNLYCIRRHFMHLIDRSGHRSLFVLCVIYKYGVCVCVSVQEQAYGPEVLGRLSPHPGGRGTFRLR